MSGENVSGITYLMSSGTLNVNSVNHVVGLNGAFNTIYAISRL